MLPVWAVAPDELRPSLSRGTPLDCVIVRGPDGAVGSLGVGTRPIVGSVGVETRLIDGSLGRLG